MAPCIVKISIVETQYNEIFGTMKFCLLYQIFCYQYLINNTKQNNVFNWDRRKQFFISRILLNMRSLYIEFPLYKQSTSHNLLNLYMYMYMYCIALKCIILDRRNSSYNFDLQCIFKKNIFWKCTARANWDRQKYSR